MRGRLREGSGGGTCQRGGGRIRDGGGGHLSIVRDGYPAKYGTRQIWMVIDCIDIERPTPAPGWLLEYVETFRY